jgi:hypothetical protein
LGLSCIHRNVLCACCSRCWLPSRGIARAWGEGHASRAWRMPPKAGATPTATLSPSVPFPMIHCGMLTVYRQLVVAMISAVQSWFECLPQLAACVHAPCTRSIDGACAPHAWTMRLQAAAWALADETGCSQRAGAHAPACWTRRSQFACA